MDDTANIDPRPAMRAKAEADGWDQKMVDRLLAKTKFDPKTGCLNWDGARTAWGYGVISWKNNTVPTHQLGYEIGHGPRGDKYVLHSCKGNRRCMSPNHLRLGTAAENMADALADGTAGRPVGKVLSDKDVCIVWGFRLQGLTGPQIRDEMGISLNTVYAIVNNRTRTEATDNEFDKWEAAGGGATEEGSNKPDGGTISGK